MFHRQRLTARAHDGNRFACVMLESANANNFLRCVATEVCLIQWKVTQSAENIIISSANKALIELRTFTERLSYTRGLSSPTGYLVVVIRDVRFSMDMPSKFELCISIKVVLVNYWHDSLIAVVND